MILLIVEHLFISTLVLAFFLVFLRKEISHQWNRFYLLGGLLLSCILPWLPSLITPFQTVGGFNSQLPVITVGLSETFSGISEPSTSAKFGIWSLWTLGSVVYAIVILQALISLMTLSRNKGMIDGVKVRKARRVTSPFSFIDTVYLPENIEYSPDEIDSIMAHETAHIRYGHSWDILTLHLIGCLVWWNPLFYLYKKLIKDIHEYQADARVIETRDAQDYSRLLWRFAIREQPMHLSHAIFHKPLKNRITMIKRQLQSSRNDLKYLLIIPLLAFIFIAHSCNDASEKVEPETTVEAQFTDKNDQGEVLKVAEVMPRFPGCEDEADDQKETCAKQKLLNYIFTNVKYPEQAKADGLDGIVVSKFVVSSDGQVYDLDIIKDPGSGMGEEVLRVLKQMSAEHTWTPGMQDGKEVNVVYTLPVKFKLE